VPAREPVQAPMQRHSAARPAAPLPPAIVSRPFGARTAPGASSLVPLLPLGLVPLVPPVPRVLVPLLKRRVLQHAVPPLRQIAFAPFFADLPRRCSWR